MKQNILIVCALFMIAACGNAEQENSELNAEAPATLVAVTPSPEPNSEEGWKVWSWEGLMAETQSSGYFPFLEEDSMSGGIYRLPGEGRDSQSPRLRDEIYLVVEGNGVLVIEEDILTVGAGSIVYVRSGVAHHFEEFSEQMIVLVLFSKAGTAEEDPDYLAFELGEITAVGSASRNVWNQFISVSSLRLGAYLLPEAVGGDGPLTHTFDEINYVLAGEGLFTVDEEEMSIAAGDLIFVEAGRAHFFTTQGEDLEILILFEGGE